MKIFYLLLLMIPVIASSDIKCKKQNRACYKGRLEIKGICQNYTIKLLQGDLDKNKMEPEWKDAQTGKTYQSVFALSNPCTFPDTLKEGDEFYFTVIATSSKENCTVCMAYYPTPEKKLNIIVTKSPCK